MYVDKQISRFVFIAINILTELSNGIFKFDLRNDIIYSFYKYLSHKKLLNQFIFSDDITIFARK